MSRVYRCKSDKGVKGTVANQTKVSRVYRCKSDKGVKGTVTNQTQVSRVHRCKSDEGFKGTVINQTLTSLHEGTLGISRIVLVLAVFVSQTAAY